MYRCVSLLAVASVLAGCSGGGGGSTPDSSIGADVTAPAVSLAASASTIEGGATVALTASATDGVDGSVPVTLSCTGGTLSGTLLVTSGVTSAATITCTATATDRAGNRGTATTTISVTPTTASVSLAMGTSMTQGQFGAMLVTNLPLTQASYAATIGTRPITAYRGTASALSFHLPVDLAPGSHLLTVQIGDRRYSRQIEVAAAASIGDPRGVVTAELGEAVTVVDQILARDGAGMTAAQRATYQGYRDQLTTALAQLPQMSASDLNALAVILSQNSGSMARPMNDAQCAASASRFATSKNLAITWMSAGLALIIIPDPTVTKLAGLAIFLKAFVNLNDALAQIDNIMAFCISDRAFALTSSGTGSGPPSDFARALQTNASYGFVNRTPRDFRLQETRRLNQGVAASVGGAFRELTDLIARLPTVPDGIASAIGRFSAETIAYVPANQVALTSVSNPNVGGQLGAAGDVISLTFTYRGEATPSSPVGFDFTLDAGGRSISLAGQLSIALPQVADGAVSLVQGRSVSSQVQISGADRIEIVKPASHGSATVGLDGAIRYTPGGQHFGTDSVEYRAVNQNGTSRTATVLFTINREFEGAWAITVVSRTTSQSSQGLCPNSENRFTAVVAKASDTLYTTNYQGFPLNFTMSSRDDPMGLRATASGTYDDPPGETTESLTIDIPNSSTLTGGTTWSYRGPNGSSCSGTTTITGSKG